MEKQYIIIYIILWAIALLTHIYKHRTFDAGAILITSYLLYAIASYILYTDFYYEILYRGITLLPFIYLFLILYITSSSIRHFNPLKIDKIQKPSMQLLNAFCIFYILMSFISLPSILSNFNALTLIMNTQDAGADLYRESVTNSQYSSSSMGSGISNLPSIFTNFLSRLSILFLFYQLTLEKRNKWIIIGLIISIALYILSYLLTGQRGGTYKVVVTSAITYFALRKFIPKSINQRIVKIGVIGLILLCIPYYFLTASRFSSNAGGLASSISAYMGQGNLNFNLYALDNNGIRYGDRVVPVFKKLMGFENVPDNFWERRWKYPNLRINDESFVTYAGDFTIDFGPVMGGAILLFLGLFVLWKTRIKKNTLLFHQLILLHFMMCICMEGGMSLYPFADSSNMVVVIYFIAYMLFKYEYLGRLRKSKDRIVSTQNHISENT